MGRMTMAGATGPPSPKVAQASTVIKSEEMQCDNNNNNNNKTTTTVMMTAMTMNSTCFPVPSPRSND
jgi:hypothetical protein